MAHRPRSPSGPSGRRSTTRQHQRRSSWSSDPVYEYPEHLRATASALPHAPGVYVFHGQAGDLPLYIGKSVDLRARVLSHLRNPDEARWLRQTTHISHIRTAGDIGAQLLEAQMIKQQQPLMNHQLRRNRQLCALRLAPNSQPEVVYAKDIDFAHTPGLYGLYASRTAALDSLRNLADQHQLCLGALGLDTLHTGRGCFRSMLKQCAGVCCGRETEEAHHNRLVNALTHLQINCWPYPGAIGLVEQWTDDDAPLTQCHVIRNWCYLGSVERPEDAHTLTRVAAGFDADGYRILCRPILSGRFQLRPLWD